MKLYDISQEVFGCAVYPGDPVPRKETLCSMEKGDLYNLTALSLCAHNGTHVDAPFHFCKNGKTIDEIPLEQLVGYAYVIEFHGIMGEEDARMILRRAMENHPRAAQKLLFKGNTVISPEAAAVFAEAGLHLLGNESQTVGPEDAPMAVHLALLGADVILLEGIRLAEVPEGVYLLNAAPLSLAGADGSPCRAWLLSL